MPPGFPSAVPVFGNAMVDVSICPLTPCACSFPLSFPLILCPRYKVPFLSLFLSAPFWLCSSKTAALIGRRDGDERKDARGHEGKDSSALKGGCIP
eukprot:3035576-Rhodomonas_salina.2